MKKLIFILGLFVYLVVIAKDGEKNKPLNNSYLPTQKIYLNNKVVLKSHFSPIREAVTGKMF